MNPTDHEPLTSAHLLRGRKVTTLPYKTRPPDTNVVANAIKSDYSTLTKRANQQKKMIDHFQDRWKLEYLTAHREYHSTTGQNTQTIKQRDVVQIHDERPRTTWKLAIIKQLITGNDGLVRAAKLKTQHGETTRLIARLYHILFAARNNVGDFTSTYAQVPTLLLAHSCTTLTLT